METRRAVDSFVDKLIPNHYAETRTDIEFDQEKGILSNLLSKIGINPNALYESEETAPSAFTYSLFYVYYDQYTYIRGVLS